MPADPTRGSWIAHLLRGLLLGPLCLCAMTLAFLHQHPGCAPRPCP